MPAIQSDFGLATDQMGHLASVFLIAYGVFQMPCGLLGDRIGARQLLTLLVLGFSATTCVTALVGLFPGGLAWPFAFLFFMRVLFGAFQAGVFPVWVA